MSGQIFPETNEAQDGQEFIREVARTHYISDNKLQGWTYCVFDDDDYSDIINHPTQEYALRFVNNKVFFKNNSGADIVIKYVGNRYVLENGKTYACDKQEKSFFIGKAFEQDTELVDATANDFFANGEEIKFFW